MSFMDSKEKNNMIDDIFAKFDGAFAKNTIKAYKADFIQYQNWCLQNKLNPFPATQKIWQRMWII
jgi:hypothetical protein